MYSWESKSSKKRKRNRLLLIITIVVVVTTPLFVGSAGFIRIMNLKHQRNSLHQQLLILKAEKEVVDKRIELYLQSKELIERKARDELGMIRDGEKVFQVQLPEKP